MFGGVIGAATTFVAYRYDLLQTLGAWTSGDFSGGAARPLRAAVAGGRGDRARLPVRRPVHRRRAWAGASPINLGVRYDRVVNTGLVLASVITAVVVVTVGEIPFVGLIVPNLVTLVLGDNLRYAAPGRPRSPGRCSCCCATSSAG